MVNNAFRACSLGSLMKIRNNANVQIDEDRCFGGMSMISALQKASKIFCLAQSVQRIESAPVVDEQSDTELETIDAVIRQSWLLRSHCSDLDFLDESSILDVEGYVLRRLNVQENFGTSCLEYLISHREDTIIIMPDQSQWT